MAPWALGCYRNLFGNRPHKAGQFTGDGHGDDVGVFAACPEAPVAPTEPDLSLPTDVLDDCGLFFQAQLQMPTDFGRIPVSPGAFNQRPSGMGVLRFGNRPLPTMVPSRVLRGNQSQEFHEFSWVLKTRQVTDFGHPGDGHSELHTA